MGKELEPTNETKKNEHVKSVSRNSQKQKMNYLAISKNAENECLLAKIGVDTAENEPEVLI